VGGGGGVGVVVGVWGGGGGLEREGITPSKEELVLRKVSRETDSLCVIDLVHRAEEKRGQEGPWYLVTRSRNVRSKKYAESEAQKRGVGATSLCRKTKGSESVRKTPLSASYKGRIGRYFLSSEGIERTNAVTRGRLVKVCVAA